MARATTTISRRPAAVVTDVQPSRLRHAVDAAAEQDVDLVVIVHAVPGQRRPPFDAAKIADLVRQFRAGRRSSISIETVPAALQLGESGTTRSAGWR